MKKNLIIPPKLKSGDTIRVIAPARSQAMPWLNKKEVVSLARQRFADLGLKVTFGKHIYEIDDFNSSSIESRIFDLHEAFADRSINMVISAIGGFNSNQLLKYVDYDLIKNNPKIFCGYSDITALANAIYAKTGLMTYYGPHHFTFSYQRGIEYIQEYFKKCFFSEDSFVISPSTSWSDDGTNVKTEESEVADNDGYWIINTGQAQGKIIGGNQCTLNLLQGTEFMPDISDAVLFLEDDYEVDAATFDRDLQSLIDLPEFKTVRGLVIGRFQRESKVNKKLITQVIKSKKELAAIPVIANADFGHTTPIFTFPIGGEVVLSVSEHEVSLKITKH